MKNPLRWLLILIVFNLLRMIKKTAETEQTEVQGKSLNGAQTQSLLAIMSQFTAGSLSEGQAVKLISTAIGISKDEAREILNGNI